MEGRLTGGVSDLSSNSGHVPALGSPGYVELALLDLAPVVAAAASRLVSAGTAFPCVLPNPHKVQNVGCW